MSFLARFSVFFMQYTMIVGSQSAHFSTSRENGPIFEMVPGEQENTLWIFKKIVFNIYMTWRVQFAIFECDCEFLTNIRNGSKVASRKKSPKNTCFSTFLHLQTKENIEI